MNFDEPLEKLCAKAQSEVQAGKSGRRPTWAPPLVLDNELAELCQQLGWLKPEEPSIARLWARFRDPTRNNGAAICTGFELHIGTERKGEIIFETMQYTGRRKPRQWGRSGHTGSGAAGLATAIPRAGYPIHELSSIGNGILSWFGLLNWRSSVLRNSLGMPMHK